MSVEEELTSDNDISEFPPRAAAAAATTTSAFYDRKKQSKAIRVLTVLAYVLSVSLAAIFLSVYYIFVWDGHVDSEVAKRYYQETGRAASEPVIVEGHGHGYGDGDDDDEEETSQILSGSNDKNEGGSKAQESASRVTEGRGVGFSSNVTEESGSSNESTTLEDFQVGLPEPTVDYDDSMLFTTDLNGEENSTWLPAGSADFNSDNSDFAFDKRSVFIKKLFGNQNAIPE